MMKQASLQRLLPAIAALVFLIAGGGISSTVYALSSEQRKVFDMGIYYYDAEGSAGTSCGGTSLVGSENGEKIFNFFIGRGLEAFQAAGIIGNMMHESGLEPQRMQGVHDRKVPAEEWQDINGGGWGIVQWTKGSKFIDPTKAAGKDPNDLGVQLDFLWEQLEGRGPIPEKQAGDDIKGTRDVENATVAFQGTEPGQTVQYGGKSYGPYYGFERPADKQGSIGRRIDNAKGILAQYGSIETSNSSSGTISCAPGSGGEVLDGYSLPIDKKWYVDNPEIFNDRHHDYAAIDIPLPIGTPVYAIVSGKVITAPTTGGCGVGLVVDIGDNILMTYCHGSDGGSVAGARQGDEVKAGQLIMHSASTGSSTGPHLHVQISVSGTLVCPQGLLNSLAKGSVLDIKTLPSSGCVGKGKI